MQVDQDWVDLMAPLLALQQQIARHCAIKPTAMMLPLSAAPREATMAFGLPIVRGDRAALIYEPPRPRREEDIRDE